MENISNYPPQSNPPQYPVMQSPAVPNSTAVLVLGILSIVFFCCCYGFLGLALGQYLSLAMFIIGIIVLVKYYRKDLKNYFAFSKR